MTSSVTYACVCSGISAATVAWKPLGWQPKWFAEIHPFASAILKHHYPDVPNHGDITRIESAEPVDILVAGSPCQPFSVTGKREGMADARGGLALDTLRLARAAGARWWVWENVPGVLSSADGADFRAVIEEAVRLGYGVAWRVLDARNFGLPQSRRRLFVVGHAGGQCDYSAAVLADRSPANADVEAARQVRPDGTSSGSGDASSVYGWTGDTTPKFIPGCSPTIRSQQGGEGTGVVRDGRIRRFIPVELERLQGLPDRYTDVTFRGKPPSDKQRIYTLGNTFPVPVIRWIGEGIAVIESLLLQPPEINADE